MRSDMTYEQPIRYRDDLEQELPDEEAIVSETIALMRQTMKQTFEETRHGTSGTHAKSHGVVTGRFEVLPDLPPELAQGMFAVPATYETVVRFASEPGGIDPDTAQRARGAAVKVLDVPGEKLRDGWTSQDFLLNTWPIIPQGDAKVYLDAIRARAEHHGHYVRTVAATMAKHPAPKGTLFDRTPNIHPLAFSYYSQGAFRYGDHVAKFHIAPATDRQRELAEQTVPAGASPGILSEWVRDFFAGQEARFEFRVQLNVDPQAMPIEDASVEWDETRSPYRTVAMLILPAQESFSPARRVYAEDVMSWRPWHGLRAFRPLGSINRVRRRGYEELGKWRHDINARTEQNPTSLQEVPA
ncbi:catalase family protein [Curtobacterium sp. NPDC090217]|uniref:catalase family protein n=1 Tax=unclassified Curtobacterium TaxID=257496 RepID=UPI002481F8BD|nr:catalase family protein [Curtobacterium sp. 9128]